MFLKSLDIFGFKSFADKTRVEFAAGITALLGPNGCGKSNVVDAVKWVLGEQASKAMRAEKMEDVIFNGTETRKPLNVAEVTLTIANDEGLLPLDVPEIEIKRRLYRSGESEYFINAAPVRLKEVRELFWDTGVGKAAYSVMEQGKIDQILSSKPDERRYLFEEAAGITKFKVKGAEAERKLAKTEENMRQVEGILGEVKRSYDTLKIQADKTLKYRTLKDEVFEYELDIQLLRLKQARYDHSDREEALRKKRAERDAINADMEAANKALEENMDLVNSLEAQLAEYQKNIYGLAVEKNSREKEIRLLSEQRAESKAKISQNEGRERAANIKIEELNDDAEEQDSVVRDLRKKVTDIEENIKSFEENIQITASRIGENENGVRRAEEDIRRLEEERAAHEKDLEAITDDIVAALDAGLKEAGYSAVERRSSEASLRETLSVLKTILSGRETLIRDLGAAADRAASGGGSSQSGLSPDELKRMAESLATGLAEAAAHSEKALALFEAYRKSTPSFIDDFLAPEGIITKKRALDAKIRACREGVGERRERIADLRKTNEDLGAKIEEYRATLEDLRVNRMKMATQAQAAEEQARLIRRELAGQESLLKTIQDELFLDRRRSEEIDERIDDAESEMADIEKKGKQLTSDLEKIEKDITKKNGDLAGKQAAIKKRMTDLARMQETLEKIQLEAAQSEMEIKNIQDNFRDTHSRDLMEFEERTFTITKPTGELREKLAAGRQALKDLGSVNFAAPEEFAETKERYDFLSGQLADIAKAREDLENLTAEIRDESSQIFTATYNKIKRNFHNMFRRLFGGGRAELRLSDPNHVLESGIEIYAQPPGKKLENITLLSGGEKSMTAVALLFATYMVKPSPFCLLDEIDAALDEQNVMRFVQLLREFGAKSQFIVITHNKKTVTGASTLLGVTMEESGITKVISVRLENEELSQVDEAPQQGLFEDEEVEIEEGRELPPGIDDPSQVTEAELRPIRSRAAAEGAPAVEDAPAEDHS
ncbi:chromosome segregation SMC family protein [Leadbettera azotonutricia]|uniref:Chromosome partition protein Smc n=1 Tax=Leadbettera azotonutricia (strain ATCC BAA-888 / DSM 13862 / ZAS-9) TaxID=545695 RepID=F5YDZ8_LEAAZ|nr:AAA family ATPase [Leadbettera azotonutricia]AEF82211.1 chromosome segregation protein SMC [Leadbettera azotonutricia ZAS-9]